MPVIYKVQLESLEDALELSIEYMKKKVYNEKLLNYLINNASEKDEIKLLKLINYDMVKHQSLLKNFYIYFTGEVKPSIEMNVFNEPINYIDGIKKAFLSNQDNIELFTKFYILILQSICNESFNNMAFEILQDVQRHNCEYNFILNSNILKKIYNI